MATKIYNIIGKLLHIPTESSVPFVEEGIVTKFNGVDILQTRKYNKIHCSTYIDRLLHDHNWHEPSPNARSVMKRPTEPLPQANIPELYDNIGPKEHTVEHKQLEAEMNFSYRGLLGELMYAYVIARPDIGYALVTLSKFSNCPAL